MNQEAGFWIRLGATLLDGIIVGIPLILIVQLFTGDWRSYENLSNFLSGLYSLLLPVIWNGYTIGKKICTIQIRKVNDDLPPGLGTMLLRNLVGGLVYGLTLGIGVIVSAFMVALREDKRSIHDFIAGTVVVYDGR